MMPNSISALLRFLLSTVSEVELSILTMRKWIMCALRIANVVCRIACEFLMRIEFTYLYEWNCYIKFMWMHEVICIC